VTIRQFVAMENMNLHMSIAKRISIVISTEMNTAIADAYAKSKTPNVETKYGMRKKKNAKTTHNAIKVLLAKNVSVKYLQQNVAMEK